MEFKVGDRVRLTGDRWGHDESPRIGEEYLIEEVSKANPYFRVDDGLRWGIGVGWEAELVEEQPERLYDAEKGEWVPDSFEQNVRRILDGVAETVIKKNASYGDSALNPVRIFSKADRMEQLFVRLDDKLSRVQRGSEYPGDDTLRDIIGYATLILIARESE